MTAIEVVSVVTKMVMLMLMVMVMAIGMAIRSYSQKT